MVKIADLGVSLRPAALVRLVLDAAALVAWIVLSSEHLAPALASVGAAAFASGAVWYWSSQRPNESGALEEDAIDAPLVTRREGLQRLHAFIDKHDDRKKQVLRDAQTGLYQGWYFEERMLDEARRCLQHGISMSVVVLRFGPPTLAGWGADRSDRDVDWSAVLRAADLGTALNANEVALCLVHTERSQAEAVVDRILRQLSDGEIEAGMAIYPSEDVDPAALVELARLRAHPQRTDGGNGATSEPDRPREIGQAVVG